MSLSRELTQDEKAVLEIITSHRALVSIVFDMDWYSKKGVDYQYIDEEYLDQIADPNKNRPSRAVTFFQGLEYGIVPKYDLSLMTLSEGTPLDSEAAKNAEAKNTPILIKRGDKFSLYGYWYYKDIKWQETPLDNLMLDEMGLLQSLSFDASVMKNADIPNQLFYIVRKGHTYLPAMLNKMNMKTLEIHEHKPGQNRVTKHKDEEYKHTAKTATSLIPPDPRYMELFQCDDGIGFLWDIDECNIKKEKYVFADDWSTNSCAWIDLDTAQKVADLKERLKEKPLVTIESLREKNNAAVANKTSIYWNEILAGLPKGNIRAVFATQDVRSARLRALRGMQRAKEKLNLSKDLPLFILQPYYAKDDADPSPNRPAVFRFYSPEEQEADLKAENFDKQAEQAALDIIKNNRGLALLVPDEKQLDNYLDQIADPNTYRPSLSAEFFKKQGLPRPDVLKKVNLKTWKVHDHKPGQCRVTKHKDEIYSHTTKLPTVLLPTEPQWMDLQATYGNIGLLFDSDVCNLKKEKYVFPYEEKTDECFWLNVDSAEKLAALKQRFPAESVGSLDALRKQNNEAVSDKRQIGRNTVLAGLPKGRVDGVFCLVDDIDHRIQAQNMALRIKEKLKLKVNLPIFVIQQGQGSYTYTDALQLFDQNEYARMHPSSVAPVQQAKSFHKTAEVHKRAAAKPHKGFFKPRSWAPARDQLPKSQSADEDYVIVNAEEAKREEAKNTQSRCIIM